MKNERRGASVPLNHVNPVETYYVYTPNERCFTCKTQMAGPHPAFDVFIHGERAKKAKRLFQGVGSYADMHPTLDVYYEAGGRISSCQDHKANLEALQKALFEGNLITSKLISAAMRIGQVTVPAPISV